MSNTSTGSYPCPYCNKRKLETTATAPYVRGFLLAYQIGKKSYIGCTSCVKKKVLGEAGLSALLGWFSITALIINPFLIIYNLIQGLTISANPVKVKMKLREMGIPENPSAVNITDAGCALAASMILADGDVDDQEIRIAEEIGEKIFGDFEEANLHLLLSGSKNLPAPMDMAIILRDALDQDGKALIFKYLLAIAQADGNVSAEEKTLLQQVATGMQLDMAQFNSQG